MRKLMTFAIVVFLAGAARSWALLGLENVSTDGSLEVSGVSANNESDKNNSLSDGRGNTTTRVRIGVNAQVTEGVTGRVEIDRTPASANPSANYGGTGLNGNNLNTEQGVWQINNANVTLDNIWTLKAKLGRQFTGEAGDLVWQIGAKSDEALSINSIDGLNLDRSFLGEKLAVNVFTGKAVSRTTPFGGAALAGYNGAGDVNLSNVSATLKDVVPTAVINAGLMWGDQANQTPPKATTNDRLKIARIGIKGSVKEDMITYRGEYLQNMGDLSSGATKIEHKGNAVDLGAGVNLPNNAVGKIGIMANYVLASGDKSIDSKDKAFHDFNLLNVNTSDRYFGEIFGKSNALSAGLKPLGNGVNSGVEGRGLEVVNIGAKVVPSMWEGKYSASLDYFIFNQAVKASTDPSKKYGDEWDLILGYNHSSNVKIEGGYAMLNPDRALVGASPAKKDAVTKLFARASIKWGGESK